MFSSMLSKYKLMLDVLLVHPNRFRRSTNCINVPLRSLVWPRTLRKPNP